MLTSPEWSFGTVLRRWEENYPDDGDRVMVIARGYCLGLSVDETAPPWWRPGDIVSVLEESWEAVEDA